MSQAMQCRGCGAKFATPPQSDGDVTCPTCGSPVGPAAGVWPSAQNQPPIPHHGPQQKSSAAPIIAIVAAAGALLLLLMCGVAGTMLFWVRVASQQSMPLVVERTDSSSAEPYAVGPDFTAQHKSFRTKLTRIGPAPQQWSPLKTPAGAQRVTYRSDGLALTAFVDAPVDSKKRPGLLFLHGGFAYGNDDWNMPELFRKDGYVVMIPILRGENGQPGAFTLYNQEVNDVLAAADALARLPHVEASKIFVTGHSAGGSLAILAAMRSDRFAAATALSGCMDQRLNAEIAPFDTSREEEFRIRSPIDFAASLKCPTRLFCGSQETSLLPGIRATATSAAKAGLDVKAVTVSGDHFSSVPAGLQKTKEFFRAFR